MKGIPAQLLADYQSGTHTLAQCVLFSRLDGVEVALTSADVPVVVGGRTYLSDPGLTVTNIASTAGLAVDNLELRLLPDAAIITEADILAGRWNQAGFQLFEVNPRDPSRGINQLMEGTIGEVTMQRGGYRTELRGIEQALQQSIVWVTQKTCRYRLGSASHKDGWCRKDLTSYTHAGTFTGIVNAKVWEDSGRAEPTNYFAQGTITVTSGAAQGLRFLVKQYASGQFTLALPAVIVPEVGDTYVAVAGCDGTLATCRDKFKNVLNFGGEPHGVGEDELTKPADAYD